VFESRYVIPDISCNKSGNTIAASGDLKLYPAILWILGWLVLQPCRIRITAAAMVIKRTFIGLILKLSGTS
jgi:hypothetical protein